MRGRPPKPVEQKVREGNPGKVREGDRFDPPVPLNEIAQGWFDAHVPVLVKARGLDRIDVSLVVVAARAWERTRDVETIPRAGVARRSPDGTPTRHARVAMPTSVPPSLSASAAKRNAGESRIA